jgi:hypothetical protein
MLLGTNTIFRITTKMGNQDIEIVYKKGKQNVVVDALSRKDEDVDAFLYSISIIQPYWII